MVADIPFPLLKKLLNQVARSDDKAITQIYYHYARSLYAFARAKVKSDDVANTVVQEVFMVVCKKPESFNYTSKFSTWLCGIAMRKAMDFNRQSGGELLTVELDEVMEAMIPSDDLGTLEQMEQAERDALLRICIDQLSSDHHQVMEMAFGIGASMQEIAEIQQCAIGTVKSRLFHARKNVMACVERFYAEGVSR